MRYTVGTREDGRMTLVDQQWWTTTDVAEYLGVQVGTVSSYRQRGQMPPPDQTIGRTHMWAPSTIIGWQATRGGSKAPSTTERPNDTNPSEWLVHGERDLYRNEWVNLSLADVQTPDGERFEHHIVTMKPAAMVVIVDQEHQRVALMWRHRFASNTWNWELPGGLVDEGEEPQVTAAREVREELGWNVKNLRLIAEYEPVIGMVRARHYIYAATSFEVVGDPTELNEMERLEWVPLAEIPDRIRKGEVQSSGTLVALLRVLAMGCD